MTLEAVKVTFPQLYTILSSKIYTKIKVEFLKNKIAFYYHDSTYTKTSFHLLLLTLDFIFTMCPDHPQYITTSGCERITLSLNDCCCVASKGNPNDLSIIPRFTVLGKIPGGHPATLWHSISEMPMDFSRRHSTQLRRFR